MTSSSAKMSLYGTVGGLRTYNSHVILTKRLVRDRDMGSERLGTVQSAQSGAFYRWKQRTSNSDNNFVLVVHGGAGTMNREDATPETRVSYRTALDQALKAGYEVLRGGGEAMDAAVAAVSILEGMFRSSC